jgi:putrescine transport system substrate-binding protein
MIALVLATLLANPFLPTPEAGPKRVEALAPPDFIDRPTVAAFEKDSGYQVALDSYASDAELAERLAERRYDLLILRGPAFARRVATLSALDRRRLPNARLVQPAVAAKWATYDRAGLYGVPFGWSAFGLLYDADKTREPPVSFAQLLGVKETQRLGACGVVWPDAREESFAAVWRVMGLDPAKAKPADVKSAGVALERASGAFIAFAAPDEVGALAKGSGCLGAGTAGEAAAVAARAGDAAPPIRFAYPREGATLAIYAYAIPAKAPAPDAAYALLDALLAPDNARRDAASAGVNSAQDAGDLDELKRLAPEPAFDAALTSAIQAEWKRLTTAK